MKHSHIRMPCGFVAGMLAGALLLAAAGAACGSTGVTPEPTTIGFLVLGTILVAINGRRGTGLRKGRTGR
jgi:hypothetical protein